MADEVRNYWLEAEFEGVQFPAGECSHEQGIDLVVHEAYLKPGGEVEITGEKVRKGKISVPMLNDIGYGQLFPNTYRSLWSAVKANPVGRFTHPVEGVMQATLHNWHVISSPDNASGVIIEIDWIEDNASGQGRTDAILLQDDTPTSLETSSVESDSLMTELASAPA